MLPQVPQLCVLAAGRSSNTTKMARIMSLKVMLVMFLLNDVFIGIKPEPDLAKYKEMLQDRLHGSSTEWPDATEKTVPAILYGNYGPVVYI